jgi:hypothetical protein
MINTAVFAKEDVLLLRCCCVNTDQSTREEIDKIIADNLNWEYVFSMACLHNIATLLYKHLSCAQDPLTIPQHYLKQLKKAYYRTAYLNLVLSNEFRTICEAFASANIELMPLKGISFLNNLYPDFAMRHLSDIDILTKKECLEKAKKILENSGYVSIPTTFHSRDRHFHAIHCKEIKSFKIVTELHWDIDFNDSPYSIRIDDFWDRAAVFNVQGYTYYNLSVEDTIILNCFHLLRDQQEHAHIISLKNLCDISELIKKYGEKIRWEAIVDRAKQYKIIRPVLLALTLADRLLSAPVPAIIKEKLHEEHFDENMVTVLIQNKIFNKERDVLFLPSGLQSEANGKTTIGLKPLNMVRTMYLYVRANYERNPSIMLCLKYTLKGFYRSLINYMRIIKQTGINFKKSDAVFTELISRKEEIKAVDNWLRS